MAEDVKKRSYDSSRRRAAAEQTRRRVLAAAHELFTAEGYGATSVKDIAERAGVSVDTLYTAVGRKPQVLLTVVDRVLGEGAGPVDAEQRGYVQAIRAAATAVAKIEIYATALGRLLPQVVPLLEALREAGGRDEHCRVAYDAVVERRATHMLRFVQDLRSTGAMRPDISDATAAALVWSMNSPEFYRLLSSRGLDVQGYVDVVRDVWLRTLLSP